MRISPPIVFDGNPNVHSLTIGVSGAGGGGWGEHTGQRVVTVTVTPDGTSKSYPNPAHGEGAQSEPRTIGITALLEQYALSHESKVATMSYAVPQAGGSGERTHSTRQFTRISIPLRDDGESFLGLLDELEKAQALRREDRARAQTAFNEMQAQENEMQPREEPPRGAFTSRLSGHPAGPLPLFGH